jgi:hypothetical protein
MHVCHSVEYAMFGGALAACLLAGLGGLVVAFVRYVLVVGLRGSLWRLCRHTAPKTPGRSRGLVA